MKIAGLILAGGRSNRLGEHKFQRNLGGTPLIDHAVYRFSSQVDCLAVNLPRNCVVSDYKILHEPEESAGKVGPLGGVLLGLDWAKAVSANALITMPVDVPFFPHDLTSKLLASFSGEAPACVSENGQRHGLCTLWPVDCLPVFLNAFNNDGVRTVNHMLDILKVKEVNFRLEKHSRFFNINTIQDIEIAEKIIKENHDIF
ncbi:molybdenum cofactor guanylyltransferase [Kordiimonas aquimaris]|uniref:molybdenum cofactor guanylyltransferase n=1 Tax=Kordiimonas aquimaris TaxID=707591 RepID=UPI0021CE57B0|nr:molybdenum cofactor guanylyltransferase [Kordiimonas aquimaris]